MNLLCRKLLLFCCDDCGVDVPSWPFSMLAVSELRAEFSRERLLMRKKFLIFWPAVLLTLEFGLRAWPEKLRFSLECGMLASGLAVRPVMGGDGGWTARRRAAVCLAVLDVQWTAARQRWTMCLAGSGEGGDQGVDYQMDGSVQVRRRCGYVIAPRLDSAGATAWRMRWRWGGEGKGVCWWWCW